MLIVLLILMIISMLATSLLNMTTIHTRIGAADDLHQAAYYFAEAGLQNQIELMVNYMEFFYIAMGSMFTREIIFIIRYQIFQFRPCRLNPIKDSK